jgi:GAF domain-containing protein/CheY-like chemotaxis protein
MKQNPIHHSDQDSELQAQDKSGSETDLSVAPDERTRLCRALLRAPTVDDIVHACVEVIRPTRVSGISILWREGSPDRRYLATAASWGINGNPAFPADVRLSEQDFLFRPLLRTDRPIVLNDLKTDVRMSEYARSAILQAGIAGLVMLPLRTADELFGVLLISRSEEKPFTPESVRIYETLAELAEAAIEKLWLIQKNEHALAKASALYLMSQRFLKARSVNDMLQFVIDSELFGAMSGTIALLEPSDSAAGLQDQELVFWAAAGTGADVILGMRMPVTEGVIGWVVRENEPAVVPDAYADERFFSKMDRDTEFRTHSILCAPLRVEGRVIGAIELVDVRTEYLSEEGVHLLGQVADQAALLIQNRRLLDENERLLGHTKHSLQETTLLYHTGRALSQARSPQDIVYAFADHLKQEQIDQCWLALTESHSAPGREHTANFIEIVAVWDRAGHQNLQNRRFTARELPFIAQVDSPLPHVANDLDGHTDLDAQSAATLRELGARSALILPFLFGESLVGWLVLLTRRQESSFDKSQIQLYQTLADQAAIAVRNQHLLQQVQASLQEVETVHRQYLRREWTDFFQSKQDRITAVAYDGGAVVPKQDLWHPLIKEAVSKSALVTQNAANPSDQADLLPASPNGTSLVTPLKVRGHVIGALGLEDPDQTHEWTVEELSLVQEIADRVAQAIENARLLEETQASLAETERLYEATGRFSDADTTAKVIETLTHEYRMTLGPAFSGSILRAGPDPTEHIEWLEECAHWNATGIVLLHTNRFPTARYAALDRLLFQKDPVLINDPDLMSRDELPQELLDDSKDPALLAIPLVAGDTWLGVIIVLCADGSAPDARTTRFLQSLADRAAVALESARLHAETQRRAIQLEAGAKVSRAATSILEQEKLLSSVVELICDHFKYYHAQVFLLDPTSTWAVLEASTGEIGSELLAHGYALEVGGESLVGTVAGSREPQYAYDGSDNSVLIDNTDLPETRSQLAIPLQIGGRSIGVLDVHSAEHVAFGPEDISVLSTLADQLAVAIENARLYQNQLETAEKLRDVDRVKSQFLANMSHELRTPLNSIIGFSRVILKGIDGPLTDLQKQDLTAIHNSGKLLLRLINDVLDISKIAAGKMELAFEELDIAELVRSALATTAALVKEKPQMELRTNIPGDIPPVLADATRLRQVLLNLLSNAVKFTQEGYIELSVTHDGEFVSIKVKDTGIGIPSDKFDLIFQEFEQVDGSATRAVGGTGLGLPISRHFVEMHDGRIWVESEVGAGSTFTVQLPIRGRQIDGTAIDEITLDPNRRWILAVDDDPDVINLYKRYLDQQNYQVIGLPESELAAQKARELQPYAILLDVLMPNRDGWAVIHELKSSPETRDIPVIMCSFVDAAGRGFSLGAADFLVKPVTEERLLAALTRLDDDAHHDLGRPRRVLVIDDTPEDRKLLRRTLESAVEPYHVLEAGGGPEGIELIENAHPDLVVLDLMMPEMDGFAVLESLKSSRELRQVPIIIVTAKDLTEHERNRIQGRAAALFQKGLFREDEFFQDIRRALEMVSKPSHERQEPEEKP